MACTATQSRLFWSSHYGDPLRRRWQWQRRRSDSFHVAWALRSERAEVTSSRIGHTMDVPQFPGYDGVQLAYRETGSGRPLILLHGFMGMGSDWLDQGPGDTLAEMGFRLVLPDFRGHGQSPRPHDLPAYPPDVLADDALALIRHLGLGAGEYDLGGYSLGGRVVVRMLARGAEPGRAVVAGQGLAKIAGPQGGGTSRRALTALADGIAPLRSPLAHRVRGRRERLNA